jgi:preprotein translocase subunit SecD
MPSVVSTQPGQAAVDITLNRTVERRFHQVTLEHIGQLMAIVYKEISVKTHLLEGNQIPQMEKNEKVTSVARINSALGRHFQITGLSQAESQNIALLLRTGTLPVPIYITEQTTIGPQLGLANIRIGLSAIGY